ncbi:unnamed protein product [Trifolium pratense]|uniref:Uncharacterized protein n=1 Tax=Trifolium pratense TaxID=57577 RepID=A0ACB0MFY1_TRIPR|nr:unnamed protein product [Trifolium pratense]
MVILRELDDNEGKVPISSPGYLEWARQVRAHYTRANGVLNRRGFYSELWGFDVGSSNSDDDSDSDSSNDSDCVIISPSSITGKRKNPCRDLVVAGYTPVTMEVSSKYTSMEMVRSFRKTVKLSDPSHEESIITEPVSENEFVTTRNDTPPAYFYLYTNVIQPLNIWLPFTAFEAEMLKVINVAPTQLHPNSWAFIKAFEVMCLGFNLDPSIGVFFSFYQIKNLKPHSLVSISSQPNRRLLSLYASNFKNFKDSFLRVRCDEKFPNLMYDEVDDPLFPFYWTDNPRLIKGTIFETLSDFEQDTVNFLDSYVLMDTAEIFKYEGNSDALEEYLQRMRTISNEERLTFLAKARQQKANPVVAVNDPLKQLQVEEAVTKEGRSKKKHDGRISVAIPRKPAAGVAETEGVAPPPTKKQKTKNTPQPAEGAAKDKGVASSSSQPSSQDANAAVSLSWSSFDPFEFIERGVTMVGDMTRFTNTPTEDLRKKALEYEVKTVDDHLADIEKRYSETKTKLEKEIQKLKESQESEAERLKKEYEEKLAKVKESYAASETKLKENAAAQDEKISKLSKERDEAVFSAGTLGDEKTRLENDVTELQLYAANQYDEGFSFAIEQVKLLFPDLDAGRLGEADAMNRIVDGKLILYVPPE